MTAIPPAPPAPPDLAAGLAQALTFHWHPVAQAGELRAGRREGGRPLAVRILGRDLVVARLGTGALIALDDRCPHRSTRLSIGHVDGDRLRCAYHGWAYGTDGRCVEIPSMPGGPIPRSAAVRAYDVVERHDLIWVRLDSRVATEVPPCPAFGDPEMKVLAGEPYTWPVAAPRRVENFVDLAHFAWVHDGTLGRRDTPVPPLPAIRREDGELRFAYDPPGIPDEPAGTALLAASRYRMPMPATVDIEFLQPDGTRRRLWMTASPIDDTTCRSFWFVARTDDLAGDDRDHLAFQAVVLAEDEPVVSNQVPPQIPLEAGTEVSVRTDRVSIEYRRWLRDLALAALAGPTPYTHTLGLPTIAAPATTSTTSAPGETGARSA